MNQILEAAVEVERVVRTARFPFCFIGGVAVQRWGQPRMTADIDLTVITGFGTEDRYVDVLLASLRGRVADARSFALRRTLLLVASNGVHIDVSLGAMPFEERSVKRASLFKISDSDSITTCSAEDLVVYKAFAGRDKDWGDICSKRQTRRRMRRVRRLATVVDYSEPRNATRSAFSCLVKLIANRSS
jgi:hypothetical protein